MAGAQRGPSSEWHEAMPALEPVQVCRVVGCQMHAAQGTAEARQVLDRLKPQQCTSVYIPSGLGCCFDIQEAHLARDFEWRQHINHLDMASPIV